MRRWLFILGGLAVVARALGTERIADAIRWADQRLWQPQRVALTAWRARRSISSGSSGPNQRQAIVPSGASR